MLIVNHVQKLQVNDDVGLGCVTFLAYQATVVSLKFTPDSFVYYTKLESGVFPFKVNMVMCIVESHLCISI
jgi:hypothetical protein